jgi:polar amino acid transport system ATP-binding protein
VIKVENLQKNFQNVQVLKNITTEIHKGDVLCVIGPSGSGKSTFLRCLNMLETPTGGSVIFDGVDLTDKKADLDFQRRKMGMVFQQFNLFPHMTILDNMTCAPVMLKKMTREQAEEKALELLARVGLADRANA